MCTLTYLLNNDGYELFFNRDEQRKRLLALPPKLDAKKEAIYPIDPEGDGTWLAVNQYGMTLALLNFYHANKNTIVDRSIKFTSRGQLILSLLTVNEDIISYLQQLDLSIYQPFQLCIFPKDLSKHSGHVAMLQWDGIQLSTCQPKLPITSSSVSFEDVNEKRNIKFKQLTNAITPSTKQLRAFHYSNDIEEKFSVNMRRDDAQTVSISHIKVSNNISFNYIDNVLTQNHNCSTKRKQNAKRTVSI